MAILTVGLVSHAQTDPEQTRGALEMLLSVFAPESTFDVIVYVALVISLIALVQQGRSRLTIDHTGIRARMPGWLGLPGLRQTGGRWHVPWNDIRRVRLESPKRLSGIGQGLRFYRLVFTTSGDEVWVNPYVWYAPDGPDHRVDFFEIIGRAKDNFARIKNTPIVKLLEARGIEIDAGAAARTGQAAKATGKPESSQFDLTWHKGLAIQLGMLFILGGYSAIDHFFVGAYLPLEPIPKSHYLPITASALLIVTLTGRGAPATERIAVGVLALIATVAAIHPATLRFNAINAEAITATYETVNTARFAALDAELPDIDLSDHVATEYWAEFQPGSQHDFILLRGKAGFYQLYMSPLTRKIRAWYVNNGPVE